MPTAWRLAKTRHIRPPFDGEGARHYGGRWNSPGVAVAYASESISLAVLEVLAVVQRTSVLDSYSLVSADFDESAVETVAPAELPAHWRRYPAPQELQAIGDRWVAERRSLILRVPSAVIEAECNFMVNPAHPAFASMRVSAPVPFEFDTRLTRGPGRP